MRDFYFAPSIDMIYEYAKWRLMRDFLLDQATLFTPRVAFLG